MIKLARSLDGRLILGSNEPFPADVKYVEYYRDQRLFNLVFQTVDEESELMPCEVSSRTASIVQLCPNIMIIAMAGDQTGGERPYGYTVPLIQIGV